MADGDDELKEIIQARGAVEEEPGQDGGAVQVAQAEGMGIIDTAVNAANDAAAAQQE